VRLQGAARKPRGGPHQDREAVASRLRPQAPDALFIVHAGRRNEYLRPGEVPAFEGDEAWFELERVRGQVWMTWKVLRQVAAPK
jgi:hypothetical protein